MSIVNYPGFYSLNHPEPDSPQLTQDQVENPHPSFEGAAWHDDLMATLLFEKFLTFTGQGNDSAPTPTANIPSVQQNIPVEQLPPPTHQLTGPMRLKQSHPRVSHACDYCRYRKTKCSGEQPVCRSCKKKGRDCTWTPIKLVKNRVSRKNSEKTQPPSCAHSQDARAGLQQPYFAAQMQTYPSAVRPRAHSGPAFVPAMQGHPVSTPSSGLLVTHDPIVRNYWSYPGIPHLRQEWTPPPSYYPCFSSIPSHEGLPRSAYQRSGSDRHSPMTASGSRTK